MTDPNTTWESFRECFDREYKNREQVVLLQQIAMQEAMQKAGFNIVECGNCGSTLIHQRGEEEVECFCGTMDLSDCPDVYFKGMWISK